MEQESLSRRGRFPTNNRRFLAIGIGIVAVISPLYIDSKKNITEPQLEEQTFNFLLPNLPLLFLITFIMSMSISHQLARFSSYDHRLLAIGLTLVAILSPLYIDRNKFVDPELEEQSLGISSYLPLLMLLLIIAIAMSCYFDHSFTRLKKQCRVNWRTQGVKCYPPPQYRTGQFGCSHDLTDLQRHAFGSEHQNKS